MSARLKSRHFVMAAVAGLLLTFQNCTDSLKTSGVDQLASYAQNLPFAFKANADTFAYFSCSRMPSYDSNAYFTFKVGAYSQGGIGLTDDFITATKYYTAQDRAAALSQSTANAGANLQLSIRSTGNYQSVLAGTSGSLNQGQELGSYLTALNIDPIASQLASLSSGQYRNYFPGSLANRSMESAIRFLDSESVQADIRSKLDNKQALVTLTYTATNNPADASARSPAGVASATDVYGRGFLVQFNQPYGDYVANPPVLWSGGAEHRVLGSVKEIDLQTGAQVSGSTWTCPTAYQFMVVRAEDIRSGAVTNCQTTVDNPLNSTQASMLNAIRRVLPTEYWYVDLTHQCVVAKTETATTSCYGDRTGRGAINYTASGRYCSGDSCPQYLSVCVKQ